jgi:hypothetical protein
MKAEILPDIDQMLLFLMRRTNVLRGGDSVDNCNNRAAGSLPAGMFGGVEPHF